MKRGFLVSPEPRKSDCELLGNISAPPKRPRALVQIPGHKEPPPELLHAVPIDEATARHGVVTTKIPPAAPGWAPDPDMYTCVMIFKGMKEKLLALPGFPTPFFTPTPPVYAIKPAGKRYGGGFGLVATADINVGDLIVRERAIIICPGWMPIPRGQDGKADLGMYTTAMEFQLGPERMAGYFALSNCFGKQKSAFHGIMDTNSLPIGGLPGYTGGCGGVFKEISRANHSCRPNAIYSWDLVSFTGQLRALQPIKAGEQIFLAYLSSDAPRAARQAEMLSKYRFTCRCAACSLSGSYAQYSDLRRTLIALQANATAELRKTDADVAAWAMNTALPDRMLIEPAEIWLNWMLGERSMNPMLLAAVFSRLCKAYAALGDEEAVKRYATQAAALEKAFTGSDGGWLVVASAPRDSAWWGLRQITREDEHRS
ncbi:hypothetical protein CERSUDRAFT_115970 [Gelatoporia subvermispora B]|uniref:SET domain-containing protein n=1 Tax=Ceriporiopsis subvermispora (strain B) TaxID=914234 RepID=M2PIR8_CERS8|nr:hypothetical protein CERSUDRAFT_115970 [Gelatoporia subvermispora B]